MKIRYALVVAVAGVAVSWCGSLLNLLVMYENFGRMPVFMDACESWENMPLDARHACGSGGTRLAGLADWILIHHEVLSPGDFILAAGQIIVVASVLWLLVLLYTRRKFKAVK